MTVSYLRFEARRIALRTTVSPLNLSIIGGKMRQARYPSGTRCQANRRNDNIYVSQENHYRAKIIRKVPGYRGGYRKYKRRNQELREYSSPTNQ